jgi:hypothetical protein
VEMSEPTRFVSSDTVFSPDFRASTMSSLEGWPRDARVLALL